MEGVLGRLNIPIHTPLVTNTRGSLISVTLFGRVSVVSQKYTTATGLRSPYYPLHNAVTYVQHSKY
jgi:hypothetical protein